MRKGQKHSLETRKKISENTRKAMQRPEIRAKILRTAFKRGNKAWNKGLKGIHLSRKSEFKKGQFVGEKHFFWKGGIQKPKNDCVHLWAGANKRIRRPRQIYEKYFGKIPKGYVVYHLNGDKYDDRPENLRAISRAELLRINLMDKIRYKNANRKTK